VRICFYQAYGDSIISPIYGNKTFRLSLKILLWIFTSVCYYMSSEVEGEIRCLYLFMLRDYWDSFYIYSVQCLYSTVRPITYQFRTHRPAVIEYLKPSAFNSGCFNAFSVWMLMFVSFPKGITLIDGVCEENTVLNSCT
jgi:hypothetical protein